MTTQENRRIQIFRPAACSDRDLTAFEQLVVRAGEVTPDGLAQRIIQAESLALAYENGALVAVGAIKRPVASHRLKVFEKAAVPADADSIDLELGWIGVDKEWQGRGLGYSVCRELVKTVGARPIFATTRADNHNMLRILSKTGFSQRGGLFEISEHPERLISLLVRG